MLSIYCPVYNSTPYLDRLFASLLELPIPDVQLIFVDDGSTDGSLAMLESFAAGRDNTEVIRNPDNRGVGATANRAISRVSGDYFVRCDSDDEIIAGGVLAALKLAEDGKLDLVFTPYLNITVEGEETTKSTRPPSDGSVLASFWRFGDWRPSLTTTLVRTEFARCKNLSFIESRGLIGEDTLWFSQLVCDLEEANYGATDQPSYRYHRRGGSASNPTRSGRAQHARYAEGLLLRNAEMERLGREFVRDGHLSEEEMHTGIAAARSAQILRALRKSGQCSRALIEYHRIRQDHGVTREMRREFLRSLPQGIWGLLTP